MRMQGWISAAIERIRVLTWVD